MSRNLLITFLLSISLQASTTVVDCGGQKYDIAEENLIKLMKDYVQTHEKSIEKKAQKLQEEAKKKIRNYKPKDLTEKLTPALKDNVRYPDPSYTVKQDIKDANGNIMYHKGYKFNPLHYITLTDRYVFFDFSNKEQVQWVINSGLANDISTRLIITNGNYFDAMNYFKRDVFYCNDALIDRFQLKHTPSIVMQVGDRIKLIEYHVKKEDMNEKK